uniref:Baculoviral IAP repeat-containing protein n=1 Tax=Trachysalambria curvirostris majanivirus TaxID=2984281 RepID=A0A9C7BR02_9VIRU|nr:MAG: baculoviral IAP repeat-containing protein [Trachysalambria curvirostris majanivirus]
MELKPTVVKYFINQIDLKYEENRLATFIGWPLEWLQPSDLAADGFYYLGKKDYCICVFCRKVFSKWKKTENFKDVHFQYSRGCKFINGYAVGDIPIKFSKIINKYKDNGNNFDDKDVYGPGDTSIYNSITPKKNEDNVNLSLLESIKKKKIIKHTPAKYPVYTSYESRLNSLNNWKFNQSKEDLANAGFFYYGLNDHVRCYACGGGIRNWEAHDNPWELHATFNINCPHVQLTYDKDIIKKVELERLKPSSSVGPISMTDADLDVLMDLDYIRKAKEVGFIVYDIRIALKEHIEQTGRPFNSYGECVENIRYIRDREEELSGYTGFEDGDDNNVGDTDTDTDTDDDNDGDDDGSETLSENSTTYRYPSSTSFMTHQIDPSPSLNFSPSSLPASALANGLDPASSRTFNNDISTTSTTDPSSIMETTPTSPIISNALINENDPSFSPPSLPASALANGLDPASSQTLNNDNFTTSTTDPSSIIISNTLIHENDPSFSPPSLPASALANGLDPASSQTLNNDNFTTSTTDPSSIIISNTLIHENDPSFSPPSLPASALANGLDPASSQTLNNDNFTTSTTDPSSIIISNTLIHENDPSFSPPSLPASFLSYAIDYTSFQTLNSSSSITTTITNDINNNNITHQNDPSFDPFFSVSPQTPNNNDNNDDNDCLKCKVCLDKNLEIVLLPCQHLIMCGSCLLKIKKCPMCRKSINAFMKDMEPVNRVLEGETTLESGHHFHIKDHLKAIRKYYNQSICCHVRTGTMIIGFWHTMIYGIILYGTILDKDLETLTKFIGLLGVLTIYNTPLFIKCYILAMILLLVYGAFTRKPSHLIHFFILIVIDYCLVSSLIISYMVSISDIHQWIVDLPLFPLRQWLLAINTKWLTFLLVSYFINILIVKAYCINVVWCCYKYFMSKYEEEQLLLQYINGRLSQINQENNQTLRVEKNLPDYDTAIADPQYRGNLLDPRTQSPPSYEVAIATVSS